MDSTEEPIHLHPTGFGIIDSTLREGEQFANAFFSTRDKIQIATLLDAFGVEYIETTSPCASPKSEEDCRTLAQLGLKAKVLTHIRCHLDDAKRAVDTGVDGVDVVMGTSRFLREHGHGKSMDQVIEQALDVVGWLRKQNVEVRFSTEDSMRSDPEELLSVYRAVDRLGLDRVGIADTVGIGTPQQVSALVRRVVAEVSAAVEFHGHNDTGCAIANTYSALCAGARYLDTSVLGIGERNGITPLGGLIARLYAHDTQLVEKYNRHLLYELDHVVAAKIGVDVPFNNIITGFAAFSHKAGIHAKAVLNNPQTYEVLKPEDFGMRRYIHVAHRLTGWNAIQNRAEQIGLDLSEQEARSLAAIIKEMADSGRLTLDDVDTVLHSHRQGTRSEDPSPPSTPKANSSLNVAESMEEGVSHD